MLTIEDVDDECYYLNKLNKAKAKIERLQKQLKEANEAIERFYNTNCKLCTVDNDLCNTCRNKVIIDYIEKWGVK